MKSEARPEGPAVNSRARQGVDLGQKNFEARRAGTLTVGPSGLKNDWCANHALTGAAIDCRPFGPKAFVKATTYGGVVGIHVIYFAFKNFR